VQLTVTSALGSRPLEFDVSAVWNGGWAGRDQAEVRAHVAELAAHGVPAPAVTPIWFPLSTNLATTAGRVQVISGESSGEVEYALLFAPEEVLVTVASDHSDRGFERYSIQASKQLYPNVIAPDAWPLSECEDHWDSLQLRCWITGAGSRRLYQEAALSSLIGAREWIRVLEREGIARPGLVFLSGTPGTVGGLAYGDAYELELADPVRGRAIRHSYTVEVLGPGHQ
jgi:hypothetical protein